MLADNFQTDDRVIDLFQNDEPNKELPSDLIEFLNTFDAAPEFKITVQSFNNEMYTGRPSTVGEFADSIPNYHALVKMNGPKWYRYKLIWTDPRGKGKKYQNIDIDLTGKNWQVIAKEGDLERTQKKREMFKDEMVENATMMGFAPPGQQKSGPEAMKDTIDMMTPLLALIKSGNDDGGMGFKEMMLFMVQMQQSASNQMMQMFGMMNKQNSNLTEAMMGNEKGSLDKMFKMAAQMLDFREKISPKEETLIDKVGKFVGDNIETIGELMSKSKEERERDTGYNKVKNDWRFKKIREKMESNEVFAKNLIAHIDGKVGPESTDQLLEGFIKYKRKPPEEEEEVKDAEDDITEEDFEEEAA